MNLYPESGGPQYHRQDTCRVVFMAAWQRQRKDRGLWSHPDGREVLQGSNNAKTSDSKSGKRSVWSVKGHTVKSNGFRRETAIF